MTTTDVLIVGAGPTGLFLAAQLLRCNVDFILIDKKEGVTELSKALVVHARTLEIYDQVGLARPAVADGAIAHYLALLHDGDVGARLEFSDIGKKLSPFPFVLLYEQSKNERLLYRYLQAAGKDIRWQTGLQRLTQNDAGVTAVVETSAGETQTILAKYLVGCDGASSPTRHLLKMGFGGSTFPRLFYVADVTMELAAEVGTIYAAFGSDAFVLLFPMAGEKQWRLIGNLPEYEPQAARTPGDREPDVPYAVIENKVKALVQRSLDITNVNWFSTYKVHTRHAEAFSSGRCFLAGDAAHVHTPAGGQGMNTGIQDAYNLAWKLAFVLKGQATDALLETYNTERHANAKRLLQTTDQMFETMTGAAWYQRFFREHVFPSLARFAWRFDATKEFIFPTLSQIGIHYPDSALSQHENDPDFHVKAGDRMPYFEVNGASVYDLLLAPRFHLLLFSNQKNECAPLEAEAKAAYGKVLDFHVLPLLPRVMELFGTQQPFAVLLRPDNHIAFLAPSVTIHEVNAYFARFGAAR